MQPGYTAQISARHSEEPVHYFFFASYEFPRRCLWLLGAIERAAFLANATYFAAGEQVHPDYHIRPGHEIYNISISELTSPATWLSTITATA